MSDGGASVPDWQRYATLAVQGAPAGAAPVEAATLLAHVQNRIDWSKEIPASLLRGAVATTTLAIGQIALGETDQQAIARRAVAGAMIGEVGAVFGRIATEVGSREPTDRAVLEGMLLYGEDTASRYAALFAAARRGDLSPR